MVCATVKSGMECGFMTKSGCGFNGGSCYIIAEKCEGCGKIIEHSSAKYCLVYPDPGAKWSIGGCPTATHLKKTVKESQKINPLKASKRSKK